jgi:phosphoglycerol transferase MdoB-like AlkP superfamily enzyme
MSLSFRVNYHFWFKLTFIYIFIQNIVRMMLVIERPTGFVNMANSMLYGFIWDITAWSILSIPLMVSSLLFKEESHAKFSQSIFNHVSTFVFSFVFLFIGFCELVFWNEFHSRFNFIAVDYLVYTNEVLANIRESFPMGIITSSVLVVAFAFTKLTPLIRFKVWSKQLFFKKRTTFALFGILIPTILTLGVAPWLEMHEQNFHDDQLARNGLIEFVRAFRSNRIDYQAFYPTLPSGTVQKVMSDKKVTLGTSTVPFNGKHPNVVFITVESLGAKFISTLDGQKETTPYLNDLSGKSVFFKNFYATGTRTVRALEALNLSVPPTPGYAVGKRPDHKDLYSMGHTFTENGYDPIFLYGGSGFFDNMNSFFSGNGFSVVDEGDFKKNEITFSNAWGACDEDLFNKAHQMILQRSESDKPFLMFMLTTSNHRPFTYPAGKIDIPSGTSRAGAVKYTDFAIGKFLESVKDEKWAQNTIFVIVADHSTEGRGRFDLDMSDFHIPLWIYAPKLLSPQVINNLSSQIDLLPGLIHLLGLKDQSPFFGQSPFNPNWKDERAFIGNYQYVGYYKEQILTTLGPNRIVRNFSYNPVTKKQKVHKESPFINEAISYYQSASNMLDSGQFKFIKK